MGMGGPTKEEGTKWKKTRVQSTKLLVFNRRRRFRVPRMQSAKLLGTKRRRREGTRTQPAMLLVPRGAMGMVGRRVGTRVWRWKRLSKWRIRSKGSRLQSAKHLGPKRE